MVKAIVGEWIHLTGIKPIYSVDLIAKTKGFYAAGNQKLNLLPSP